ncbi:MAG: sigma-70 family RNA polymerase sigma factor [Firmicutes bacterium]|nr:sigma-70 family RNA polymerase sigma factor [[Eubacterium] siraeum]MCM1487655.1 sigma-70 family RNA polymerase sigma factor [Bacillota bacterium]
MAEMTANILVLNKSDKEGKNLTEADLVKELQNGSTEAFCALIDKYTPYVCSVISRIIGYRQEDCKELVSDVFLAVWSSRHKLQGDKVKAYMGEIARNKAFNFIRGQKEELPLDEEILFNGESPEEYAEKRELSLILKKALSQLSPQRKELLLRYYYYGQKIGEAAKEMNINSSTARVWLKRARTELGEILRKDNIEL